MTRKNGPTPAPRYSIEAEQSVLGSLLLDVSAVPLVSGFLESGHFFREAHALVYESILHLHAYGKPPDMVLLSDELERRGVLADVGGYAYLTKLLGSVPTSSHAEHYGRVVWREAVMRRLAEEAGYIAHLAFEAEDASDAVARAMERLSGLAGVTATDTEWSSLVDWEHLVADRVVSLRTGLTKLDEMIGGFAAGELVLLAGRPSIGKTALGCSVSLNAGVAGQRVLIFSLEMGRARLWRRFRRMSTPEVLRQVRIGIARNTQLSSAQLRAQAAAEHARSPLGLIVVDYIGLLSDITGKDRVAALGNAAWAFKSLAMQTGVPVLCLAQLNRGLMHRENKRPVLSDLRDSGNLEEHSDMVLLLHRPSYYDEKLASRVRKQGKDPTEIVVAKNRDGASGLVEVAFIPDKTKFEDLEDTHEIPF